MGLVPLLNRLFRAHSLSAPLAVPVGGADGVSVMRPIEGQANATSEETASTEPADPAVEPSETQKLADIMKAAIMQYGAAWDSASPESDPEAESSEATPIARLANTVVQQAIKERASDIHLETGEKYMRVRFRIDGVLHEAFPIPRYIYSPLLHRYKILAGIDIATHRGRPQEGLISLQYRGEDYSLRVRSQPTRMGDRLTLHIDSLKEAQVSIAKLGFTPNMQAMLEELLFHTRGLILLTGPPGSGKTTLQYALLNRLNTIGVHIATVEERASHRMQGITQTIVDLAEGGTMAETIREVMRSDVDVLAIDEIRDRATARAALDAAAGALVIATMQGNDTLSTLLRLREMGFDPGLIADTVCGVTALRLVRKICPQCRETYEVAARELHRFGMSQEEPEAQTTIARGAGCEQCKQSGYQGRMGLYELFYWEPTLTKMFAERATLPDLKAAAYWNDRTRDMRADGLLKILAHQTTPQEIYRMLP